MDDVRDDGAHGYEDIIGLPYRGSPTRRHMPRQDRAAQFAPFAALSGYGEVIGETARLTEERIELDEDEKTAIDGRLQWLKSRQTARPEAAITYFRPDAQKPGGAYVTVTGAVRRVDDCARAVVLTDGTRVPIAAIRAIESDLFRDPQWRDGWE